MARENTHHSKYRYTRAGVTCTMHTNSKSCKDGQIIRPDYTLAELRAWIDAQPIFDKLFDKWVQAGHTGETKPTLIRISLKKPHTLDNLKIGLRKNINLKIDNPKTVHDADWFLWRRVICKPWSEGAVL